MPEITDQMRNHLTANAYISKKNIMIYNFLGGVAWGFGTLVGATIIAAIIIWLFHSIGIFSGLTQYLPNSNQQTQNTQIYNKPLTR